MNETKPRNTQAPLAGLRVVDLSRLVAGNMLTLQLADFGAEVIKVEAIGTGDPLRHWLSCAPGSDESFDSWWQVYGRNKRSLSLNLRSDAAREILLSLLELADVLVESFKPGTLESMGLAPDELLDRYDRLVIVRVSGWGQTGPYSGLPGFGSLIEGMCGFANSHMTIDGKPTLPNMALADMVAGLTGAFATMAALRQVEQGDGRGQVIDLSLLEPMLAVMGPQATAWARTGVLPDPRTKIASPRGVFRCGDGKWISLSGSTEKMAERVFIAIGCGELYESDPDFRSNAGRLGRDAEIDTYINAFVSGRSREECLAYFRNRSITVGPIYDVEGLVADTHIVERHAFVKQQGGTDRAVFMHQPTPRMSRTPGVVRHMAPKLGEHSREILSAAGVESEAIDVFIRKGIVECL
ncbi:CoA transferase [Paraburkholderia agricolaris]|uniref:CaiB/BaiF CoA transferase family protein n=1 Tax=Paraburkholderia agricolaris TaxID=2152888 RepID=UPI0012919805|nr:CoA transferase [Paraburkholderia agricolaris]